MMFCPGPSYCMFFVLLKKVIIEIMDNRPVCRRKYFLCHHRNRIF